MKSIISAGLLLVATASAQTAYTLTDLGSLPGYGQSAATALNASGQVVGIAFDKSFTKTHAFLYTEGRMTDLGTLAGGTFSAARGINSSGQIVGVSEVLTGSRRDFHAFSFANGGMTNLGVISGEDSYANGINASGQIVGESDVSGDFYGSHAFLYANGRMTDLGTLGGSSSAAVAINDAGQIAGTSDLAFGSHAFLYSGGAMIDLGTLGPRDGSWANAINGSGEVVGASYIGGFGVPIYDEHAFLYSGGKMTDLGTLAPYGSSEAKGINASGQIVGAVYDLHDGDGYDSTSQRAFIYVGGKMTDLNTRLTGTRGWVLLQATAINESGLIVGFGLNPAGELRAFLLTPSSLPLDPVVPVIVRAPASQSVILGSPAIFGVIASGANLTYQWKKNGVAIAGATNATYGIASMAAGDAGSYSVVVSAEGNSVESAAATLAVMIPPVAVRLSFFAQPVSVEVRQGGSVTFSVGVTGGTPTYQWKKNGVALTGATNATYVIASAAAGDAGSYSVVVVISGSSNESGSANLAVVVPVTVAIVAQPAGANVNLGSTVTFTVAATGGNLAYQWKKNGAVIAGATGATLTLTNTAASDMGFYSVVVSSGPNAIESSIAILTVASGGASRLANLSTRGLVPTGGDLTVGFVIRGSGSKSLLLRAIGPTLEAFGVTGALVDPKLSIIPTGASTSTISNDNWGGSASLVDVFAGAGAFALPATSKDAALVIGVPAAGFSAQVTSSVVGGSGLALAEVYDRDAPGTASRLANVSTRGFAGTGAQALAPGFVIDGAAAKRLLIRAVGPGLAPFGVTGTLPDPQIAVIPLGKTFTVAGNDDWDGTAATTTAFAQAGAFALPAGSKDAALVVRLPPGGYTVQVSDTGGTTGTVLVEIYDLDP